jgi:Na+/H+ antiporter NhaD/arsenite permease-like protein
VVGTLIVITIVKQMLLPLDVMLITLAFSITVGSVMTPIGNPQNMLIASQSGMSAPFFSFVKVLGIPTLINLAIVAGFLWFSLKRSGKLLYGKGVVVIEEEHINDLGLAKTSGACLVLAVGGFLLNDMLGLWMLPHAEHLGIIAFLASVPLYTLAGDKRDLLQQVDWSSIVFFLSMFIVMAGLWQSGAANIFLNLIPSPNPMDRGSAIVNIMLVSTVLSQVFSNVPLVKLYIDVMKSLGFNYTHQYAWLALASGSTIAGNLTILGAASNVIILETSENRTGQSFSFLSFLKKGVIVTVLNILVYVVWIYFFG